MFKPYDLVIVRNADYDHYGEVISRCTDTGTYMVRMVPQDPGTMRECPEGMLLEKKLGKGRKGWIHYAEVSGAGQFPLDMLRYDFAAPANFMFGPDPHMPGSITTVLDAGCDKLIIAKLGYGKKPLWTTERWASSQWKITPLVSILYTPNS
jgi:hypothetical protein